jgi:hypothetical protein
MAVAPMASWFEYLDIAGTVLTERLGGVERCARRSNRHALASRSPQRAGPTRRRRRQVVSIDARSLGPRGADSSAARSLAAGRAGASAVRATASSIARDMACAPRQRVRWQICHVAPGPPSGRVPVAVRTAATHVTGRPAGYRPGPTSPERWAADTPPHLCRLRAGNVLRHRRGRHGPRLPGLSGRTGRLTGAASRPTHPPCPCRRRSRGPGNGRRRPRCCPVPASNHPETGSKSLRVPVARVAPGRGGDRRRLNRCRHGGR